MKNLLIFAQSWYEQHKKSGQTGWKSLDRDGDGQACDCLPDGGGNKCPKKRKSNHYEI